MVAKKYYDTLLEITEIMDEKGRGMDEKEKSTCRMESVRCAVFRYDLLCSRIRKAALGHRCSGCTAGKSYR